MIIGASAYAWWVKVRVIRLRQDFFDIRDQLFDDVAKIGAFDDPGYRAAREHLNRLAEAAPSMSLLLLGVVAFMMDEGSGVVVAKTFHSDDPRVQELITRALRESSKRLFSYLLNETLTGIAMRMIAGRSARPDSGLRRINMVVNSDLPNRLSHAA